MLYVTHVLPDTKNSDQNEAHDHRSDDSYVARRLVRCVDDSDECQTDTGDDDGSAYIVKVLDSLVPGDTLGMFWRLVEGENGG